MVSGESVCEYRRQICSLWLTPDRIPSDTALEFVRSSRDWGERNPQHFIASNTGPESLPDIESGRDKYDIVTCDLEPGDAIIFRANVVHGAPANVSERRRRAWSARRLGEDYPAVCQRSASE